MPPVPLLPRQQQRLSPEGVLQQQLADARHEAAKLKERADRALAAKRRYKEQVGGNWVARETGCGPV